MVLNFSFLFSSYLYIFWPIYDSYLCSASSLVFSSNFIFENTIIQLYAGSSISTLSIPRPNFVLVVLCTCFAESDNLGSTDSEVKKILSLHMPISEYDTLGSDSEGPGTRDSPPTFAESAGLAHAHIHAHPAHSSRSRPESAISQVRSSTDIFKHRVRSRQQGESVDLMTNKVGALKMFVYMVYA